MDAHTEEEPIELATLRPMSSDLDLNDQATLVDQARLLLEALYVHLPLKRSMLAIDPVQALRVLRSDLPDIPTEMAFNRRLMRVFNSLRDLHTSITLPDPWRRFVAYLPLLIEVWHDHDGRRRYVVSKISRQLDDGAFTVGAEVTHWNGVPIDHYVELFSEQNAGANIAARRARALYTLTVRPMGFMAPPEADWVVLTWLEPGMGLSQETRIPWRVFRYVEPPDSLETSDPAALLSTMLGHRPLSMAVGIDHGSSVVQQTRQRLLHPEDWALGIGAGPAELSASGATHPFARSVNARVVSTQHGEFGYLRLYNFEVTEVDAFLDTVRGLLADLPESGLIIDIRGNPGGTIPAGERLLQFFTDAPIQPQRVQFRHTDLIHKLIHKLEWLDPWRRSASLAVRTGDIYSEAVPLTSVEAANDIGRVYPGRSVLITDALVYSTGDFFAAGYKDHNIGPVLGVDPGTGAGGGNVWSHDLLRVLWSGQDSPVMPLPGGCQMRVAVRRSVRVGASSGLPVEGFGVKPDVLHQMTYTDLMQGNVDLIERAAGLLAGAL